MTVEGIRVSPAWLGLREPADAAARSRELAAQARWRLAASGGLVIHDLACGTGSMGRWLAPLLPGPQRWVLHDRDPDLLRIAAEERPGGAADGAAVEVETALGDITRLAPADLAGATLVTASALLDLMTAEEVTGLAELCVRAGCPALVTLTVVGRVELTPADPLDARIAAAFDAHQRRRTAGGRLLGPDAVGAAVAAFRARGAEVLVRPSPWELGAPDAGLILEWLDGWVGAACEQEPALVAEAGAYAERRRDETRAGRLAVRVHHADLLALPARGNPDARLARTAGGGP